MPPALFDVFFYFFKTFGVIFFHHTVADRARKIEFVLRIFFQQRNIVVDGALYVLFYRCGILPSPLRVQMRIGYEINQLLSHNNPLYNRLQYCTIIIRAMQYAIYLFNKTITAAANLPAFRSKHTAFLNIITGWESM